MKPEIAVLKMIYEPALAALERDFTVHKAYAAPDPIAWLKQHCANARAAVSTTTTDADGHYLFDNLPLGQYTVTITPPSGVSATLTGKGTTATDSSTGFAVSADLQTDGAQDLTLDFGFWAPSVLVGNYVWFDTNHDGLQDATDIPIPGVTLTITKTGDPGATVYDVYGNVVTTTTTDETGHYLFAPLPYGQYTVTVTAPGSLVPTLAGEGGDAALDSSTGSEIGRAHV